MAENTQSSSERNDAKSLVSALRAAYAFSVSLIALFGASAYFLYRHVDFVKNPKTGEILDGCLDRVCQNILTNLSQGPLFKLVGILLVVSTIPSYILILTPAREHIELAVMSRWVHSSPMVGTTAALGDFWLRNIIRTILVSGTALIAARDPHFGSALGAVGGLTDSFQSFIIPILVFFAGHKSNILSPVGDSQSESFMSVIERIYYCAVSGWGVSIILYTLTVLIFGHSIEIDKLAHVFLGSTLIFIFSHRWICRGLIRPQKSSLGGDRSTELERLI